jgi:hypothetical protein
MNPKASSLSTDEFAKGLLRATLSVYPKASADYMINEPNPFLNPSGNTIKEAVKVLSEWILNPDSKKMNTKPLERLMRFLALEKVAMESFWEYFLKAQEGLSIRRDWALGMSRRYHSVLSRMNELKEEATRDILAIRYKEMTRQSGGLKRSQENGP